MLSHKNSFGLIKRMENLEDECNQSELNYKEIN
jgi:hypothetical protein